MKTLEMALVDWLQAQSVHRAPVSLGVGDDMAAVELTARQVLFSTDMLLDGVHFDCRKHTLFQVGRKAVACGLSDCAAMAVRPLAVLTSVAVPDSLTLHQLQQFFDGAQTIAAEFDAPLVGGDTTRWRNPMVVDVAVAAVPFAGVKPVTRMGANPGDRLYVTGPLGGSLMGHHLAFVPRVPEAQRLAVALGDRLHAMIDISDGLSLDLWRICQASGVGAVLDEALLNGVISDDARNLAESDARSPQHHALTDGEDFELLLAVDGEIDTALGDVYPIGMVTETGLQIRRENGRTEPLKPEGFVH